MLKKLIQYYGEAITTTYNPNDLQFEWFQTEVGQPFGILKSSLTNSEIDLLTSLFEQIKIVEEDFFSGSQRKWYDYLFVNHQDPHSPLPTEHTSVRFYYFYLKQPIEDKQNFEEAVKGILNSDLVIWLSLSHGMIIEEKPDAILEVESLKDLSDTLTTDFYVEPFIYIGQLQKNDVTLRDKFFLEQSCFQNIHRSSNRDKVLSFYEVLPLLIMKSPSTIKKEILSNHLVEAIEDKELLHTIEAFFQANLNASSTAKRLFIHRNSLQYRLEKLLEKTGLDIRNFSNAAFIFLAIFLAQQED